MYVEIYVTLSRREFTVRCSETPVHDTNKSRASCSLSILKGFKIGHIDIDRLNVLTVNEKIRLEKSVLDWEVEVPGYDRYC